MTQPSDTITYAPTQQSQTFNTGVNIFLIALGSLFFIVGCFLSVGLFFIFPPAILVTCGLAVIGLGLAGFIAWRWYNTGKQELQLSSQTLRRLMGKETFVVTLAQVTRLQVLQGSNWYTDPSTNMRRQVYYWYIRIEDEGGHYIDLDITQGGHIGMYDVPRILRDLLPRLPASAQIDPRIQAYLSTGQMA